MATTDEPPERVFAPINRPESASSPVARTHSNGSQIHRADSHRSHKEARDPNLDINLPYRTLSANANLAEYSVERPSGEIDGPLEKDGKQRYKLVTFEPNDPENPKNWSKGMKWYVTMVVAATCFVVAFCSSVITADIEGVEREFDVSEEVALVSITVFVVGFGIGMTSKIHKVRY